MNDGFLHSCYKIILLTLAKGMLLLVSKEVRGGNIIKREDILRSTMQKMKKRNMNRAPISQGGDPDSNFSRMVVMAALKVRY